MIAGNLRHKIEILKPTATRNIYGEETIVWNSLIILRAEKKEIRSNDSINNNELFNYKDILFITYYRNNITEDCRVKYNNVLYKINSLKEIGYKDGLQIEVEKINI